MKILVIGSGGREHSICWKFSQSHKVKKVFCAGTNDGISNVAQLVDIDICDFEKLAEFAKRNKIDFTFVGPEIPLSLGIVDYFESKGLKIVGPCKEAAKLEASKIYSKQFMEKYGIPTAKYNSFSYLDDALNFLDKIDKDKKLVVKADGLAAGKGVYICGDSVSAKNAVKQIMHEKILGDAGINVLIEEFICGEELSYLIFTDGKHYSMMPAAQDHKRINDNDEGPNTGGMGAYAPAPLASKSLNKKVEENILKKVMTGLQKENLDYRGILYVGVIVSGGEPYVLEFNCRFGDPETQAVLPLLESDLVDICQAILDRNLDKIKISWKKGFSVCVVLASGGYPDAYRSGFEIKGLEDIKEALIFLAGTKIKDAKLFTNGGRVLGITALDDDIKSAVDKVYSQVALIDFENMHYRKDIAAKALKNKTEDL
ncbi:MAG: phosphoribosylamine--glycine ligase [Elusimicrobiota bacterium]|jgi:phosphoribosylamine--glycine ligase|nr:phosphoribosylamine--glycine ligase [Elusimicrobiota bacterium]